MPTYQAGTPRPAQEHGQGPDPSGQKPHGYYRDVYFGTLAPAKKTVEWSGHTNECDLRILEADEQRWCSRYAYVRSEGHADSSDYLEARSIALIARSLEAVDGKPISDECKTIDHRLQMAAELSDTLQEALIAAYDEARYEPIALVQEMAQVPPSAPTPTPSGSLSAPAVSRSEA